MLDHQDSSLKRGSIIPGEGSNIVGSKDGYEEVKFTMVKEFIKKGRERERVNGSTSGGDSDGQRSGVWKDRVISDLSVKEVEWPNVRGARTSEDAIFHWQFEIMCKCRIIPLIPGIT